MERVTWAQTKDGTKGKYLRVGLGDRGFFNCYDRPIPSVAKGDEVEFDSIDESKKVVKGLRKATDFTSSPSSPSSPSSYVAIFTSYAKDLLLSEMSDISTVEQAATACEEIIARFGVDREGCMLASYVKDLMCAGYRLDVAINMVEDLKMEIAAIEVRGEGV